MRKIEISKIEDGVTIVKMYEENTPEKSQKQTYSLGANLIYNVENNVVLIQDNAGIHRPIIFSFEEIVDPPTVDLESYFNYLNDNLFFLVKSNSSGSSSGNFIPLTGTEVGSPVTGDIEINSAKLFTEKSGETFELNFQEKFIGYKSLLGNYGISFNPTPEGVTKVIDEINNIGLLGEADFSEAYPANKLIYAQRSYVDKANSYSTDETLTGGTWIDGKPIYRKVLVFNTLPSDIFIDTSILLPNVDTPIKQNFVIDGTTNFIGVEATESFYQGSFIKYCKSSNEIRLTYIPVGGSYNTFNKADSLILILEYTKTTD